LGVLTVVGTLGYTKDMVFGTSDDRQDRSKIEFARNSISGIRGSKAALEVLGAYERGEEISNRELKTALGLDHKWLKKLLDLEISSQLPYYMGKLAEIANNENALLLHYRIEKILKDAGK
jgi:hypothetical protein